MQLEMEAQQFGAGMNSIAPSQEIKSACVMRTSFAAVVLLENVMDFVDRAYLWKETIHHN
jgi:hypothetical protein